MTDIAIHKVLLPAGLKRLKTTQALKGCILFSSLLKWTFSLDSLKKDKASSASFAVHNNKTATGERTK